MSLKDYEALAKNAVVNAEASVKSRVGEAKWTQ